MIKSIFAVQGASADCQLASSSYFYLVIVFTVCQYNKSNAKTRGRQFSMFVSEYICTMVDLFDKAVAEREREIIIVETKSEGDDET